MSRKFFLLVDSDQMMYNTELFQTGDSIHSSRRATKREEKKELKLVAEIPSAERLR